MKLFNFNHMKITLLKLVISIILLGAGIIAGMNINSNKKADEKSDEKTKQPVVRFDDTSEITWSEDFKLVEIKSSVDSTIQKAYFYTAKPTEARPLIVSLHTWSGDFSQKDDLAGMCKANDINYIHPDFRGSNNTKDACCSHLALNDIDDAITWATENSNVDKEKIYVIGVSGGGYATLSTFMKSKHSIKKFSAWAAITDLIAWYNESKIRGNRYADNILMCTGSENGVLNESVAKAKSPVFMDTPAEKLKTSNLMIYAGIYDGIQGSVPITHSINFYNKLLSDLLVNDKSFYVPDQEKLKLLEYRKPLGEFGSISDRTICLEKKFENIRLVIFEGNHEMLTEYAFNELINE